MQFAVEVISVSYSWLFCLIDHVEDLEDQLSKQLVVTADKHGDIVLIAVIFYCVIDVGDS